jgi:hypothetical protein
MLEACRLVSNFRKVANPLQMLADVAALIAGGIEYRIGARERLKIPEFTNDHLRAIARWSEQRANEAFEEVNRLRMTLARIDELMGTEINKSTADLYDVGCREAMLDVRVLIKFEAIESI